MCFSLVACGGESQNNNNAMQVTVQSDNSADDFFAEGIAFVLRISINPEFELHVNADGNIVELKCLNEDEEKAFAGVDVSNQNIADGFRKLVDTAYENGYITKDNAQIITTLFNADDSIYDEGIIIEALNSQSDDFSRATGIALSVNIDTTTVENAMRQEQQATENTQPDKANKTQSYYNDDGNYIEESWHNAAEQRPFY